MLTLVPVRPLHSMERVSLGQGWRFQAGDGAAYADPAFDDAAWRPIETGRNWEAQGYEKLDGHAWYRVRFVLPESLREADALGDGLRLALGAVNNFDETYLNGQLIGRNGTPALPGAKPDPGFVKAPQILWSHERVYVLRSDDPRLRWGRENVLAVHVFDEGGLGGIWTDGQHVRPVALADYLGIDATSRPFVFRPEGLTKAVRLRNHSERRMLTGTLGVVATGTLSGRVWSEQRFPFALRPGTSQEIVIDVPAADEAARLEYRASLASGDPLLLSEETPYILTPVEPLEPRINGPELTAVRPDRPFLYAIPATGARPMRFSASGLPAGLEIDSETGIVSGRVAAAGRHPVTIGATNAHGTARRGLEIVVGPDLALTPPMGWNSWNCWGVNVDEEKVMASARALVASGLQAHGWSYVNVDDGWAIRSDANEPGRDERGRIRVHGGFPDMALLGRRLHDLGLKFGIYSSPGPSTCGGYTASLGHEEEDARTFAAWGVDYLKYDWCSYDRIARDDSRAELMKPYGTMRRALDAVDRDIVYSLCQYGMGRVWEWGALAGGQSWRTTEDITDTWESVSRIGFAQIENASHAGPGRWNDPDMLVVGWVGWGTALHPTRLTPDEQYAHVSLWSLLSAPLLLGCDLARLDPFTLNLLANDEVLALDQDRLGKQATPAIRDGDVQVWSKELANGDRALGVFNLGSAALGYDVDLAVLELRGPRRLRDVWRQKDLGLFEGRHSVRVPPHGVVLLRVSPGATTQLPSPGATRRDARILSTGPRSGDGHGEERTPSAREAKRPPARLRYSSLPFWRVP